tara:strand:+ start:880 stop:1128 length:249 start_codon:yes stop_codon:yes gene_type:complete
MNNTIYAIVNLSDTNAIIFSQVGETSTQTMRRNIANTQGVISYLVEPSFITNGALTPVSTLNQTEFLALMQTPEWKPADPSS